MCINSFSCPTDKFVNEIFTLLRPHVEIALINDPFVILNHIFDTYRTLQLLSTDIQNLTLSTIHINDFLKKIILLETLNSTYFNLTPLLIFIFKLLSSLLTLFYVVPLSHKSF